MRLAWSAASFAAAMACALMPAAAVENRPHDKRVEQAAMERAAAKIGELRGALAHDARLADILALPRRRLMPPRTGRPHSALPPIVMNEQWTDRLVDLVATGSIPRHRLAPVQ
ncbi:MAG: hypothetical protein MUE79_05205 [Nitratireductor sp.]|jgi:hypothetical protein|nr:hypothetical protein [Nitratireductor sp.]